MKNSLTEAELDAIISGTKRTVKINAIWDHKKDYVGGDALFNRSAGYDKVAMPHIKEHKNDSEEYRCALSIVRQIHEYREKHDER